MARRRWRTFSGTHIIQATIPVPHQHLASPNRIPRQLPLVVDMHNQWDRCPHSSRVRLAISALILFVDFLVVVLDSAGEEEGEGHADDDMAVNLKENIIVPHTGPHSRRGKDRRST